MDNDTCKLPECDKPIKRLGFCYSHYMKNWRYGTPTPEREPMWTDIIGHRFGTLVVIERQGEQWLCQCDCGRPRLARAGDLNRTGEATTCGHRTTHRRLDVVSYHTAHVRCTSDRGPIATHTCVDCGGQAQHWSYDHTDANELLGTSGYSDQLLPYSLHTSHYSPRCVPCHKTFDLNHIHAVSIDS